MKYEFENSIGMLTAFVSRGVGRQLKTNFLEKGFDTSTLEWTVLSFLANHEFYTQNELVDIIGRNKVFIKRLIDQLEGKKLVKRETLGKDKRHNKVFITQKGLERYNTLLPIVEKTIEDVFYDFNEIEVNTLIRLLRAVSENLK